MTKEINDIDVLVRILQDDDCNKKLFEALRDRLQADPVAFYRDFVIPRSGKMIGTVAENIFAKLTITQEVSDMNKRTSPSKDSADADKTDN